MKLPKSISLNFAKPCPDFKYQVLCKYLKDRHGRQLNLSEVKNIRNIIKVLAFTIEQMRQIDNFEIDP